MIATNDTTMDDTDMTMDFLDDGDFAEQADAESLVAKVSNCDMRRKIEERLERRRLCEELGLAEHELEL